MDQKYSIEVIRFSFDKAWDSLSDDEMMLSFFKDNKNVFFDFFCMTAQKDNLEHVRRVNDNGTHLNTIFYTLYQKMSKSLHPNPPERNLSLDECKKVFSTLEKRPTKDEDLMRSVIDEEERYKQGMKSNIEKDQMYTYLYYKLLKKIVEQLLCLKREVRFELLYKNLNDSSLTICQSCIVLILLHAPFVSFKEGAIACGFSEKSVSNFREHYTKFKIDPDSMAKHGRETGKNLIQIIKFLSTFGYDTSLATNYFKLFKEAAQS